MPTHGIWPLWFQQLGVHQDYVWFLVLLGWSLSLVFWWWHPQRDSTWRWVPWMGAAGVVGAAVQFGIFNPPFDFFHSRLIPGTTANYTPALITAELLGDWLIALGFGVAVAGWGWIGAKGPVWRWVALLAAGGAVVWHIGTPDIGGGLLGVGALIVGVVWVVRQRGDWRRNILVLAAAALPALSTVGPLATAIGELQRSGPPTAMGLAAACYQAAVAASLLMALWPGMRGGAPQGGTGRGAAWFLAGSAVWLLGGLGFAYQTGHDNRHELQQHRLRLTAARAGLLDPELLQAIDSPPMSLGRIEQDLARGMPLHVSPETARLTREVSRALHREWRAAPYVDDVRLIIIEDGWLLAVAGSHPSALAGTVEVLRRATPQDLEDWREGRNVIEHSPVADIGRPYFCRAALRSADGRMIGWLEFEQIEFFQSIARKWRSGPLLVTALGLVLGVMLQFQRRSAREREAALRAAAVQAEANRMKSEFLAKVSHELRTPLQSLLGYSELLRGRVAAEPQATVWLDAVRQHGELMTRLVNDLIDLGAVEAGTLRLMPRVVSPAALLRQTVDGLRWRAETKGLSLACETLPGLPPTISVDGERLRQIVLNLTGNAVKFTDRGGVTVQLRAEPAAESRLRLILTVRDTGPGIAPEDRARIFSAFSRLAPTAGKEGAGVGLALTAALCRTMGGGVRVDGAPGEGSVFTATILVDPASTADLPAAATEPGQRLGGRQVLILDDNVLVRELFVAVLDSAGARCTAVGTVAEARQALHALRPRTVILDVALPDGDGLELAAEFKRGHPGLRVVVASAHAGDTERTRAAQSGVDAFVVKPVAPPALVAAVAGEGGVAVEASVPPAGRDLGKLFLDEVRVRRPLLARAIEAGDLPAARAVAHHLANSAAVIRDTELLAACNSLVEAAERGDGAAIATAWAPCRARLAAWEATVDKEIT